MEDNQYEAPVEGGQTQELVRAIAKDRLMNKILKNGQDIWMRFQRKDIPNAQWDYAKMQNIVRYYLGRQDPAQYLSKWDKSIQNKGSELVRGAGRTGGWNPFRPINYDGMTGNLKILNHVVSTIMGNMAKQKYTPTVYREDSASNKLRENFRDSVSIAMQLKAFGIRFQSLLDDTGLTEDELPVNDFELRKKVENYQLADEMDMQVALKKKLKDYNFNASVLEQIRLNAILFGFPEVRVDWMSKRNKIRATFPYFRLSGYSRKQDCSDSPFDAEMIFVTLDELKYEASGEIDPVAWQSIEAYATTFQDFYYRYSSMVMGGSWGARQTGTILESEKGVAVLDFVYKKTERITIEKRTLSTGKSMSYIGLNKSGQNVVAEKGLEHRYGGKLIVDAGVMYQWGRILPSARDYDGHEAESVQDFFTCRSGFIGYRPMAIDGQNVTTIEKGLELINMIQQLWVKNVKIVKRILPPLISVDRFGFKQLIEGEGGKGLTPMDVATAMVGDGVNLWDSTPYNKNLSLPKGGPVQVQHTEDTRKAQEIFDLLATCFNMLREIMATPPQANGIMPGTRTGQGVSELMLAEAQTSMLPVYDAVENVVDRMDEYILLMLKYAPEEGMCDGVPYKIGEDAWKNAYKCRVKNTPTAARWERLYQFLDRYADNVMLDPDVVFAIEDCEDVKEAQLILVTAVKKARKQAMLDAQFQAQQQDQLSQNAIAAQTQSKIQIDKANNLAKTQGSLILDNQKSTAALELQDKKTDDEITIMRLEDDQMETIAKKVFSLISEKEDTKTKTK